MAINVIQLDSYQHPDNHIRRIRASKSPLNDENTQRNKENLAATETGTKDDSGESGPRKRQEAEKKWGQLVAQLTAGSIPQC